MSFLKRSSDDHRMSHNFRNFIFLRYFNLRAVTESFLPQPALNLFYRATNPDIRDRNFYTPFYSPCMAVGAYFSDKPDMPLVFGGSQATVFKGPQSLHNKVVEKPFNDQKIE